MSDCPICDGSGMEESCTACKESIDNCTCEVYDETTYSCEECSECDGTGEVEETEDDE